MVELNLNPAAVAAILVALLAAVGACIWAIKTGRVTSDMLASGTAMLEGVQSAADALAKVTKNPAVSVASYIFKAASQAARAAEQLCKTGEIGAQERNAKAKEIAEELLGLAGIDVTEDRKAAIAVLLEAECDAMGHTLRMSTCVDSEGSEEEEEASTMIGSVDPVDVSKLSEEQLRALCVLHSINCVGCQTREDYLAVVMSYFDGHRDEVMDTAEVYEEEFDVDSMSMEQLRAFCLVNGIPCNGCETREAYLATLDGFFSQNASVAGGGNGE